MADTHLTLHGLDRYTVWGKVRQRGIGFTIPTAVYSALSDAEKALFVATSTYPVKRPNTKVYDALISADDNGVLTVVVLENSLGNIAWLKDTAGVYIGTLADAFVAGKTTLDTPSIPDVAETTVVSLKRLTTSTVELSSATDVGASADDGLISGQHVRITVG